MLGRLGSPRGAVVGGLVVGVVQQLVAAQQHLGASWAPTVPLAMLVVVLAFRPDGLGAGRQVPAE
jgi:branched-subunit amino acid ABC-type transport system permease component